MNKKPKKSKSQTPPPPPAYDIFPTSMRIRTDPKTNAVIPSDQAVEDVKRWVDYNTK
ncbi:MAG: hypothetical protein R3Y35_09595 [Clostridia bacterium]